MTAKTATTRKSPQSRTRKPKATPCIECSKPAEIGRICNSCTEIINRHELTYLDGLAGNPAARKALKKLTPKERTRIAPTVLAEDDLDRFISKGIITGRHQAVTRSLRLAKQEPKIVTRTRSSRKPTPSKESTVTTKTATKPAPKTRTRTRPAGSKTTKAKAVASKPVATVKPAEGISAAEVARTAKLDGPKFRRYLRSQGISRTFKTKAQAAKAVAAYRKSIA